jgi:RNA polymerase sigma-70 factor, ECF subfamily
MMLKREPQGDRSGAPERQSPADQSGRVGPDTDAATPHRVDGRAHLPGPANVGSTQATSAAESASERSPSSGTSGPVPPHHSDNHLPASRDQSPDGMDTDQLLIRRAIEGDERALRQLWSQYAPHIDAVVMRLAGDADLAADIAQEVWMQIFRALRTFRGDAQFGTWAHRIAVNRTLNALRKERRMSRAEVEITDDTISVEPDSDRAFMAASIQRATARLPEGARTVFLLHDVEGYTHEDIARELGITAGASKSQLFKARAKLRRLLAPLVDVPEPAADGAHAAPGS